VQQSLDLGTNDFNAGHKSSERFGERGTSIAFYVHC
jgi:hypothetical protein